MSIEIIEITNKPLQLIGKCAGVCWGAPVDDPAKNRQRAISCIKANHGRVLEFPEFIIVIDGYSARMMRELYTHIGGSPTRLQSSTRYVNEDGFKYYKPESCKGHSEYDSTMETIQAAYSDLVGYIGVPKEDAANILPLGMMSKMVWKGNLRMLINFMNRRLCTRALKEIRGFANELRSLLASVDEDWSWISEFLFVPSCEQYKLHNPAMRFCVESQCCGRAPKISELTVTKEKSE